MSEISIEALAAACAEKVKQLEFSIKQSAFDSVRLELETELAIARVALLALRERAQPVAGADMCDREVFEKGTSACLVALPKETAEIICRGISAAAGCRIDWHYVGGRVHIKALRAAPPAPVVVQPVSAPYKLPEGWIACSERMPEVGDIVLTADNGCVNVGEMERSGSNYRYFTSVVSGRELPASHWMPLPEAPCKEG